MEKLVRTGKRGFDKELFKRDYDKHKYKSMGVKMLLLRNEILGKYKSVKELDTRLTDLEIEKTISHNRSKVRVAVIDDEEFMPEENLRKHHYNINKMSDLNSIEDIANYHIVLCDLSGVGSELNPELQGAHLIKQIKKAYPEKYVIAYTGGSSSREIYARAMVEADKYTQKDASIDDWTEILDKAIRQVADPAMVWRKVRHNLIDADVTPRDLTLLEDKFVREINRGEGSDIENLGKYAAKLDISSDAKAIINSIVANAIFKIVMGA